MTITVQVRDFLQAYTILETSIKENRNFSTRGKYLISRLYVSLFDEFKQSEEQRVSLIKKYGIEDKDGGTYSVPAEKIADFQKEYNIILGEELVLYVEPIPLTALDTDRDAGFSIQEFYLLGKFVESD